MGEYFVLVVVTSTVLGFFTFLSYSPLNDRLIKAAASLLLLYTVLLPTVNAVKKLGSFIDSPVFDFSLDGVSQGECEAVAQKAFIAGIHKLLFTKYEIDEADAEVVVYGFDFQTMRAEKIKILLWGKAIYADLRGIREYLNSLNLGECEVEIRIG